MVILWDAQTGEAERRMRGAFQFVGSLAFSVDGGVGSDDPEPRLTYACNNYVGRRFSLGLGVQGHTKERVRGF